MISFCFSSFVKERLAVKCVMTCFHPTQNHEEITTTYIHLKCRQNSQSLTQASAAHQGPGGCTYVMRARHPSWRRMAQAAEPGPVRLGRLVEAVRPGARLLGTYRPLRIRV